MHNTGKLLTNKSDRDGNILMKPKVVIDCNHTMGGVDRLDQHLHDYQIAKKGGKKCYKKM